MPLIVAGSAATESVRSGTSDLDLRVEAKGLEPSNLLTASQALYQLSYAPVAAQEPFSPELFVSSSNRSSNADSGSYDGMVIVAEVRTPDLRLDEIALLRASSGTSAASSISGLQPRFYPRRPSKLLDQELTGRARGAAPAPSHPE